MSSLIAPQRSLQNGDGPLDEALSLNDLISRRKKLESHSKRLEQFGWYFAVVVGLGVAGEVFGLIQQSKPLDIASAALTAIGVIGEVVISRMAFKKNGQIRCLQETIDTESDREAETLRRELDHAKALAESVNQSMAAARAGRTLSDEAKEVL